MTHAQLYEAVARQAGAGEPGELILGAVLVVACIAAVLSYRTRSRRGGGSRSGEERSSRPRPRPRSTRPRSTRPPGRPAAPATPVPPSRSAPARLPEPREIWWAQVPFEDGPGSKDRPCLVVHRGTRTATVLKITSKHHVELPGVLPLPPGTVGDRDQRASWLETDESREVPFTDFRRRVGVVDSQLWARVRKALA